MKDLLAARAARDANPHLGVAEGIDRGDLAQTGWGVVFPAVLPGSAEERAQAAIREALAPLLRHRRGQAASDCERFYQEFHGHRGVRPGDTNHTFLRRHDRRIAERPFVSGLHHKLLAHPNGGALACIGHLERVWNLSIPAAGAMNRLGVFKSAMEVLMKGGAALEFFGARYAQLGADLSSALAELELADPADADATRANLAHRWTAHNDARDYVVAGDPAVRLRFAAGDR